jgi:uncharacterized protein (DUF983 family)
MKSAPTHRSSTDARNTESALAIPTARGALSVAARTSTLRCPHCGKGWIFSGFNTVNERCAGCGFRFCRSDDNYFSGAMFFGMMIGETLAVLGIFGAIWITYPNVPWTFLQYGGPLILLAVMIAAFPFSRAVWLGVDVLMRPIQPGELAGGSSIPQQTS